MGLKCILGCHKLPWSRFGDPEVQGEGYKPYESQLYHPLKEQKGPNVGQFRCQSFGRYMFRKYGRTSEGT